MAGWYCVRSGRGRGCYPLPDPGTVPLQMELELDVPVAPADVEPAPFHLPAGHRYGELLDCTGPCARPMKPAVWLRQRGRCSTCGPEEQRADPT